MYVRIGLHTGRLIPGHIGFGRKMEYAVTEGDAVNAAKRVEALNPEMETRILITCRVF
ncbi:hypothetical protein DIJ64_02480 [Mycobacterium leprae]|uniref:Guanylate cyclase domain-containing protein n=1 Tax=Mycobacterium leprae TaxID=1769 RepID=A0AAD0KV78_MYCLR|nr:adenylate/guanylate cyclase domain-containing protein [Mycobacterium leprae]AWV47366.1 hypothetical protein DIJ64_02480 [Mycobacterium leprae]